MCLLSVFQRLAPPAEHQPLSSWRRNADSQKAQPPPSEAKRTWGLCRVWPSRLAAMSRSLDGEEAGVELRCTPPPGGRRFDRLGYRRQGGRGNEWKQGAVGSRCTPRQDSVQRELLKEPDHGGQPLLVRGRCWQLDLFRRQEPAAG